MGNICGSESKPTSSSGHGADPFSQPGRTLGSAPPTRPNPRSSVPANVTAHPPGRTLGGSTTASASASAATAPRRTDADDARRAAASAAEERARRANQPKGKLASQLAKERQQTRAETLQQASRDERRARDADSSAEARNWN